MSPDVPVAVVDSYVVLRNISEAYTRGMRAAIDEFLQRPGPTLIIAPSRYIGLTRSIVDLLCRFARGAGAARGVKWPYLEAPPNCLRHWHKLDAVTCWVDPDVPVAVVYDQMVPQEFSTVDEHILHAIRIFLERPGPTLLVAPAQEIGLTRPAVDLLCWFAKHPNAPMFAVRGVHRLNPNMAMRWPDPLPHGLEQPVPCPWTKDPE